MIIQYLKILISGVKRETLLFQGPENARALWFQRVQKKRHAALCLCCGCATLWRCAVAVVQLVLIIGLVALVRSAAARPSRHHQLFVRSAIGGRLVALLHAPAFLPGLPAVSGRLLLLLLFGLLVGL